MAYNETLAERIRRLLVERTDVVEKKMFGGLCFMVSGHMCCGIVNDTLMARVGADNYSRCLARKHTREMDFTGRTLKGMVYVAPEGLKTSKALSGWLDICLGFVCNLPPKKPRQSI